jgi:coenzyme F420-0:L-glutamate ligase/coenzyme F420-1:gamma-L-glutamate ligase
MPAFASPVFRNKFQGSNMSVTIWPINGIKMIASGDDLAALIAAAIDGAGLVPQSGDILVLAQKIVSKAEGRQFALADIAPSLEAKTLALEVNKDARIVELILSESTEVVRKAKDVLIVAHKLGFVHANAGIDQSNIEGEEQALLLPVDSDASAKALRSALEKHFGVTLGVIIADSMGRAWRKGTMGVAIGVSGTDALQDLRGETDLAGRKLEITEVGRADELAAAAGLVMGQGAEGIPVALIRGVTSIDPQDSVNALLRKPGEDLFR